MLKKNILVLSFIVCALIVSGCNSKKKSHDYTVNGNVVFFQNIEGTSDLYLKAENTALRNSYGRVAFQKFTGAVSLPVGTWQVTVVDDKNDEDTTNDVDLFSDEFAVTTQTALVAITKDATNTIQLKTLPFAEDHTDRSINVTQLNKELGAVDIYVIPETQDAVDDPANPTNFANFADYKLSNITFGNSSATLDIPVGTGGEKGVYIYVFDAGNTTSPRFTSGLRELNDALLQTLVISKNTQSVSYPVKISYYHDGTQDSFSDVNLGANLRVVNFYDDNVDVQAELEDASVMKTITSAPLSALDASTFADGALSIQNLYYVLTAQASGTPLTPSLRVKPMAGEQQTIVLYGNKTTASMNFLKIDENQAMVSGQANLTIALPIYLYAGESLLSFDIYLLKAGDFNLASPTYTSMYYGYVRNNNYDPDTYRVVVTPAGKTDLQYLSSTITLDADKKTSLYFYRNSTTGLFGLCEINEANPTVCAP